MGACETIGRWGGWRASGLGARESIIEFAPPAQIYGAGYVISMVFGHQRMIITMLMGFLVCIFAILFSLPESKSRYTKKIHLRRQHRQQNQQQNQQLNQQQHQQLDQQLNQQHEQQKNIKQTERGN